MRDIPRQAEEEGDRLVREEREARDENFLKEKRVVDDEWIDHTADDELDTIKVRDMGDE